MKHKLKRKSSFIVVVLRSLRHGACVRCNTPIRSLEESSKHWETELKKSKRINYENTVFAGAYNKNPPA